MKTKKIKKKLLHSAIFINFVMFFYFIKTLPVFLYPEISRWVGSLSFFLMGSTRERVYKNLKISYGNKLSLKQRGNITKKLFSNIILSFCELVKATKTSDKQILSTVHIEGEEKLQAALKTGNGVIGVCSHMGNFPLLETVLVKMGYPANVIVRDPTAEYLAKFCSKLARGANVPYISKRDIRTAVQEAQNWMATNKGILSFYLDQHAGNGVKVDFFGKQVFAPAGAALFAKKYRCPALGIFTYREKNGRHKIVIEGPYPLRNTDNTQEDIKYNTALFIKRVEHYVNLCPEQWFSWLHRRFR